MTANFFGFEYGLLSMMIVLTPLEILNAPSINKSKTELIFILVAKHTVAYCGNVIKPLTRHESIALQVVGTSIFDPRPYFYTPWSIKLA